MEGIRYSEHERLAATALPAHRAVVGGTLAKALERETVHVSPTTGRPQATVALAGRGDLDDAVTAACEAQRAWWRARVDERRDALLRLAALVRRHAADFAPVLTVEAAVPAATAAALPARAADYLEYYAGYADKLDGRVVPVFPERALDYTLAEPYGVIGVITTWNGGVSALARKIAPALAAGNAVVAKPSELAPFSALMLGDLALRAGLPPGLVNVLPGDAAAGEALAAHPGIAKVTFTGGPAAGRAVQRAAAAGPAPVLLELGGKSASVVFPDADLDAAARFSGSVPMGMAGQGCVFPTRLLVHDSVYDDFLAAVTRTAAALPFGDPLDPATVVGPVISRHHQRRVLGMIDRAVADGAVLLTGGHAGTGELAAGSFVEPTVFDRPRPEAEIVREEVFGPVLVAMPFRDEEEAVALANDGEHGLAGYVFTSDVHRAHRVAAALDAGYVSVNGFAALPASAPFGGRRASGHGREGGRAGIEEFVSWKNVYLPMP